MIEPTIVTVTLNPSIDLPIALNELHIGETNRCIESALDAGGKGINASRVIRRLGGNTVAYGFAGGITGALLRKRLDEENVPHAFDEIEGLTRLDVMLFERSLNRRTRLLGEGPPIEARHLDGLRSRLASIPAGSYVVLGGSIPPGIAPTIYRDLVVWLNERSVHCIVDISGEALRDVLEAHPALIKPNEEEAGEAVGRALSGETEILAAARELRARGAQSVVISLGAQGAIGVTDNGAWKVDVPEVEVHSTVGSGDSMVGGLALSLNRGSSFVDAVALGAAAGTAAAMAADRHLCHPPDVQDVLRRIRIRSFSSVLTSM